MYAIHRVEPDQPIGPARSFDHALMLADAGGPGLYEVLAIGDLSRHLCLIARKEDGTFILDPRQSGGLTAMLCGTLDRA